MDADWMAEAIGLTGGTRPHPNPRVGAVVLDREGQMVAAASHARAGEPHAEEIALREAGTAARGGTLIVTLEPCPHVGRTPPCVDAIMAAGIDRVIVGAIDPDPRVSGIGVRELTEAGIQVEVGMLTDEVEASDPAYFHHRRTGRPRLTLKAATTLDGQVAAEDRSSQWITGEAARADAHRLRAEVDGVVIGAGTLREDDPRLTVRLPSHDGFQPVPIVILGRRPLPASARLLGRDDLIVISPIEQRSYSGKLLVVPDEMGERVDLQKAVELLGQEEGLLDLLVEGGSKLFGSLWQARLVDRLILYFGAKVAGGTGQPLFEGAFAALADASNWDIADVSRLGGDLRVTAEPGAG